MQVVWNRAARVAALALCALVVAPTMGRVQAADWQAGAGAEWAELLAAAKREGKVTIAGYPPLARPLSEAFKRDTGLDIEFLGGNTTEIASRLMREAQSGNVTVDLSFGGAGYVLSLYPRGYLVPIKPQLILPGVQDGPQWLGGKRLWVDTEGQYLFRGTRSVHGWPLANSTVIAAGMIKSWKDLLSPEYKGKIASIDPTASGPGQGVAGYLADRFGIEFVTALYVGQNVRYTRDQRQLIDWVSRGTYPIALGAEPRSFGEFLKEGLPLLPVVFEDGQGYLTSGFSVLNEMKGAPHPKAAAVFINWYASQPGQEVYSRLMLDPSTRTDVPMPSIPDYVRPKLGTEYIDSHTEAWYGSVMPGMNASIVKALGGR